MNTAGDSMMGRIGQATALGQQDDRAAARRLFAELWAEIGPDGDALHRCALAHSMADVQDDVNDELVWDLRALEAAGAVSDDRAAGAGMTAPAAALYPSLHLNLGEAYRKLDDPTAARRHLELGRQAAGALDDSGYSTMIKGGLENLATRLAT